MTLPSWPAPQEEPHLPPQQQAYTPPPPRGWYPDPQAPGRERWWSGFDWTEATHAASYSHPASSLGAYTRSRWAGLNRAAKFGEWAAGVGVLVFFGWFIVATVDASGSRTISPALVAFTIFTVALVIATIVLSAIGLVQSTYFGGAALAGWSLVVGIVLALGFLATAAGFSQVLVS